MALTVGLRSAFMALALTVTGAAEAQPNAPEVSAEAYTQDIETFRAEMKARHANPFATVSEAEFDRQLDALRARAGSLTHNQFIVEMTRVGATLREGHTGFFPMFDGRLGLPILPIEIVQTTDGWTIFGATAEHANLLGARITHIGGVPMQRVAATLADLYPRDTDAALPKGIVELARTPALLEGAGLVARARDAQTLRVLTARGARIVRLNTIAKTLDRVSVRGFVTVGGDDVLWVSRRNTPWWSTTIDGGRTLYLQFNSADTGRDAEWDADAFGRFAEAFVAQVRSDPNITRLVLDLRWNSGGSYTNTRRLLNDIVRADRFAARGALFVLTSPRTFSAATLHMEAIETWLDPIIVGEASAGRPGHRAELGRFRLPNTQLEMRYSTQTATTSIEHRPAFAPHLYTPFSSADLLAGRDPALEAVASFDVNRTVGAEMQRAMDTGGVGAALDRYRELRRTAAHRYLFDETVLDNFGAGLLEARPADALRILELNAAEYPHLPGVYDSIARAQRALGRNADAIANYRRAITMDRRYGYAWPVVQELEREAATR